VASISLRWPGRDDAPIEPLASPRWSVDRPSPAEAPAELLVGDNLAVMRALLAEGHEGRYAIAYLDPPYMSGVDYAVESADARTHAYGDRWSDAGAYLDQLWPRLRACHRLLAPHGTLWLQLDHRATFLAAPLLIELFGEAQLRNAIAWRRAPPLGRQAAAKQFPRNADTLLAFARGPRPRWNPQLTVQPIDPSQARYDADRDRHFTLAPRGDYTDESVARLEAEGRIHRTPSGKVYVKYWLERLPDGRLGKPRAVDSVWDDIAATRHVAKSERTGYPTQKPEALLARIVAATSDPGDWVLDPYGGSGTTALVAARAGRRAVTIDASEVAVGTMRERFARAGVALATRTLIGGAHALAAPVE
jgi:DNA modification methylase